MNADSQTPRPTPRILLVEDDPSIARGLVFNLQREGYRVVHHDHGEHALRVASDPEAGIALILLDLGLPDLDGTEVLQRLRADGCTLPVICLSARGSEPEVVMGLSMGADDYIRKPFGLAELLARIAVRLRAPAPSAEERSTLVLDGAQVTWDARTVERDGVSESLTPIETDLLRYLSDRPDQAVAREELLKALWGVDNKATTRTLDNHLARLRRKVESDPQSPRHLLTVHGVGYRFRP